METFSNDSKKKGWQRISQQIKSFFKTKPNSIKGEEIDYYHQYVFPRKIERMKRMNNEPISYRKTSRKKQ